MDDNNSSLESRPFCTLAALFGSFACPVNWIRPKYRLAEHKLSDNNELTFKIIFLLVQVICNFISYTTHEPETVVLARQITYFSK
jgi:hypothetical protein